jgi:hypothetical protein
MAGIYFIGLAQAHGPESCICAFVISEYIDSSGSYQKETVLLVLLLSQRHNKNKMSTPNSVSIIDRKFQRMKHI